MVAVGTSQTAQFRAMGIVLGANRHPMDVPFVREFWWGRTVGCYMSPRKPNFGKQCCRLCTTAQDDVFFVLALHGSTSLTRGSVPSSGIYVNKNTDVFLNIYVYVE